MRNVWPHSLNGFFQNKWINKGHGNIHLCVNYLLETKTQNMSTAVYETAIFFECPDWANDFYACDIIWLSDFWDLYLCLNLFLPFPSETWNGSGPLDGPLPIQWPGSPASLWWKTLPWAPQRRLIQARGKRQLWLLLKHKDVTALILPHSDVSLLLPL